MRYLILLLMLAALPVQARTIADSAGRIVEIPENVTTVFAAGPPAAILLYIMKPEAMTGWPRALRAEERDYIAAPYRDLPETGRLTGRGGEANLERVLQIEPDLILDFGSVRDTYIDLADRVQAQTGIPYILIDGRFENTPDALRLLGEALGVPERGTALAEDVEATFARIDNILEDIPEKDRPRVYLARGPEGLETGMKGSINTEIIERAGGRNVADDDGIRAGPGFHGTGDRGQSGYHRDVGPQFLRKGVRRSAVAGHRCGQRRAGLSVAHRTLRLDRPAAVTQPDDGSDLDGRTAVS